MSRCHNREKLYQKLLDDLASTDVWATEQKLTKVLFDMEVKGIKIHGRRTVEDLVKTIPNYLSDLIGEIKDITGEHSSLISQLIAMN